MKKNTQNKTKSFLKSKTLKVPFKLLKKCQLLFNDLTKQTSKQINKYKGGCATPLVVMRGGLVHNDFGRNTRGKCRAKV